MCLCGGTCLQACLLGVGSSRGKHLHSSNVPFWKEEIKPQTNWTQWMSHLAGWALVTNNKVLTQVSGCSAGFCFPDRRLMGTESKVSQEALAQFWEWSQYWFPTLMTKLGNIALVLGWEPLQCQEESWEPGGEQLISPREPYNSLQVTAEPDGGKTRQLSHSPVY